MFRSIFLKFLLSVGVAASLAACQTTASSPPLHQEYVGEFRFSNGQVLPLPEGRWTSVASVHRRNNHNNLLETVTLVATQNDQVTGLVVGRTNIDSARGGWTVPRRCQRNDTHLAEVESYNTRDTFCWGIVHADFSKNIHGYWGEVLSPYFDYLRGQGIKAPKAMIDVELYKAKPSRFLTARYYWNPEAEGFAAPDVAVWQNSDWNVSNVARDPKKTAYLDRLKSWGREMIPRFKSAE